jgi:hypothetical protein
VTTGAAFISRHVLAREVSATQACVEPDVGLAFSRSHAPDAEYNESSKQANFAGRDKHRQSLM